MTLVERMARAICAETAHEMPDPNYFADRNWHHWTPEALAALKAIRDITPAEKAPGVAAYVKVDRSCRPVAFLAGWQGVIDAAISEAERHVNEEG